MAKTRCMEHKGSHWLASTQRPPPPWVYQDVEVRRWYSLASASYRTYIEQLRYRSHHKQVATPASPAADISSQLQHGWKPEQVSRQAQRGIPTAGGFVTLLSPSVQIRDPGEGIAADRVPRVFEFVNAIFAITRIGQRDNWQIAEPVLQKTYPYLHGGLTRAIRDGKSQ